MKRKLLVLVVVGIIAVLSIFLTSCKTEEFSVTLTETQGVTYGGFEGLSIEEGGSFSFTLTLAEDYNNSTITVKVNGNVITPVDGVYTISDISEIKTVTVEGVIADTYTVAMTQTTGITYGGYQSLTVTEGDSFSFTATLGAAYNNTPVTVKANGIALTAVNGVYTISDIKENKTVTVEGVTADTYTVTLTPTTGITYGGYQSLTVTEGGSFSFTATLGAAYNNTLVTVKANGIALTAVNGVYTISDIKENKTITVEGVTADTYTVTLTPTTGITYEGYESLAVTEGGSFNFTAALGEAYNNSSITVKANGAAITAVSGVYTINNITENKTITVEGVTADSYTVTLTPTTGINYGGYQSLTVAEGADFSFNVVLEEAYTNSIIVVKAGGAEIFAPNGIYTISDITENKTVTVEGVIANTYTVELISKTGVTYGGYESLTVPHGGSFSFTVTIDEAYNNSEITVVANGITLVDNEGIYTITDITANRTVTVFGVTADTYTVTLAPTVGISYGGYESLTVAENGSFSFSVTLGGAYDNSTITVKANGAILTAIEGVYTISNITGDQTVTVEGVTADTYTIILTENTGITYGGYESLTVTENGSFSFTVTLDEAYNNSDITVKTNGFTLIENGGLYIIEGITDDQTVTVEGITADTYTVTLTETTGVIYGGYESLTPLEGDSFGFTVTLAESHNNSAITVRINGVAISATSGIYTITNINENKTVTVEGVVADRYNITLTETSHVIFGGDENRTIAEGGTFLFTVSLEENYNNSEITVKVNGEVLESTGSSYIVENITVDITITVEGVTEDTYTITLTHTVHVSYLLWDDAMVLEGGSFTFQVELEENYNNSEIIIKVNGVALTAVDGKYTISDITEDKTVTVEGVTLNIYSVTLAQAYGASYGGYESLTVPAGEDFAFTVTIDEGLSIYEYFGGVKSNGISLTAISEGSYAVSNVTADQTITISGIGTSGLTLVGWTLSKGVNVPTVILPEGTKNIVSNAFKDCTGVTDLSIPDSVNNIYPNALEATTWYNALPDGVVYAGKVAYRYKGTMPVDFQMELIPGTTAIASQAFRNQTNLGKVILPDSILEINELSFMQSGITSINIPDGVTRILNETFKNCARLGTVTFSENSALTSIIYGAFSNSGLTSFTVPSSVTVISYDVFRDCAQLVNLTIPEDSDFENIGMEAFTNTPWYVNQPEGILYIGKAVYEYYGDVPENGTITIRPGTTMICDYAFANCEGLKNIVLPDSVRRIGESAFEGCSSLLSIVLPEGVTEIKEDTFYRCSALTSVTLPQSLVLIDAYAFQETFALEEITIPSSVIYMGMDVFYECDNLTIYCEGVLPGEYWHPQWNSTACPVVWGYGQPEVIYSFDSNGGSAVEAISATTLTQRPFPILEGKYFVGWYVNQDLSDEPIGREFYSATNITLYAKWSDTRPVTEGLFFNLSSSEDSYAVVNYDGEDEIIYIPEEYEGLPVTTINSAFYNNSSISRVYLPDSIIEITNGAFYECKNLSFIEMSANLEYIGFYAFQNTKLTSVHIPSSVTEIGEWAFYLCASLVEVTFGTDIDIESIDIGTFSNCSSLSSIEMPDSVIYIGTQAFAQCSNLSSVLLNENLYAIEEDAFKGCSSLEEIIIPANVGVIQDNVFALCYSLTIYCVGAAPGEDWYMYWNSQRNPIVWGYGLPDITFNFETNGGETIASIVAPALFSLPQPTKPGSYFLGWYDNELFDGEILRAPYYITEGSSVILYAEWWSEGYPEMMANSFNYMPSTDGSYYILSLYKGSQSIVYVPSSYNGKPVLEIGGGAFAGADITDVYIPEDVTTIWEFAFQNCLKLAHISLPSTLESIGTWAFSGCNSLTSISLGSAVNNISELAFGFCENLSEINVHQDNADYMSIDGIVFDKTGEKLVQYPNGKPEKSYTVPSSVKTIGAGAFSFSLLETIIIPEGVIDIESDAFSECAWLKNIVLPNSLETIGVYAFWRCFSLVTVVIPRGITYISSNIFNNCNLLESVYIPIEVSVIDEYAFIECFNLTIYCEAESIPSGWQNEWYGESKAVVWGYAIP